jgi:hypothetical protein
LPKAVKTVFLLDPYTWNGEQSQNFANKCTYALSTSPLITKKITQKSIIFNDLLCPFDPVTQLIPTSRIDSRFTGSVFYNAFGLSSTERQCLRAIADTVQICCPDIKSVIGCYNSRIPPEPGLDTQTYDWKLLEYLKRTDWIVDLNPQPLIGFFAAFAGSLGLQWSGFDLPPNTDEYSTARRHLIPYPEGGLIRNNVESITEHIIRQLTFVFKTDLDRNKGVRSVSKRFDGFIKGMNQIFGKKENKKKRR